MAPQPPHARHARRTRGTTRRVLGSAALAGLALTAAPAAHAAHTDSDDATLPDAGPAATSGSARFSDLHLYPLAGTPLDLLSNNLAVPVGGYNVSTFPVTAPFHDGLPLRELPLVGRFLP